MKNFFAELKRRNVYKVAVAYAVASWLLIQIATQVFPFFEIPNWAVRLVVLLLIAGFPVALVFSWAFEITPEGIKRESQIESDKSITHHTGRKIVALTVVLGLVAAGLLAFQLWGPKRLATAARNVDSENAASVPEKSIAVLPFDNLSDDKSNAYFAEGIQDEILTRLSKIAALKVISRTSTQKYKSAPDNLRNVGKELGVANLLEGSVQKIANAVHVNVQLVKAATDEHIWAESYNRKLDDVFGVEGEVAAAIADQLNAKLSRSEQKAVAEKPTQNAAAYDAYLRGLNIEHNNYNYDAYVQAEGNYRRAVDLDPNFGIAWARLAILGSFLNFNAIDLNTYTADSVKQAVDRAVALAPDAAESWIAQGSYRYRIVRDFNSALEAYDEAQKRLPNSALVYEYRGFVLRRLGRWQEAEASYKKAIELDPRDVQLLTSVGNEFYMYLRRFDDALASIDRALQIAPDAAGEHANKAVVLQAAGRIDEARQELALVPNDVLDDWVVAARVTQAMYERHFSEAVNIVQRKLNSLPPNQPLDSFAKAFEVQMGQCQEWLGQHEAAQQTFERALRYIKPTPDTVVGPDANGTPSVLAQAYAGLNEKEKALQQAARAVKDYDGDAVNQPQAEVPFAQIQARFGDYDSAIEALPRLLEVPAGITRADLKFNPLWDPLRKDPRFQKLIAENGTPK
jgi:TolB-like protein/cytochrome c-type biogenesis protein CcmH/NrfG